MRANLSRLNLRLRTVATETHQSQSADQEFLVERFFAYCLLSIWGQIWKIDKYSKDLFVNFPDLTPGQFTGLMPVNQPQTTVLTILAIPLIILTQEALSNRNNR
jgi:hypothetical protein